MEYSYYNNAGVKDNTLVKRLAKAKPSYMMVDQARQFSEQEKLKYLLGKLQPGDVVATESLETLVAGSITTLVKVVHKIVVELQVELDIADPPQRLSAADGAWVGLALADLMRFDRTMRGLVRAGVSGRPRLDVDVKRAKLLKAKGKSWKQIEKALGCSARTIRDRIAQTEKTKES